MTSDRPTLAVRLPNWVGDVIMSLPTAVQLHRCGFDLQLVGRGWAKDLLAGLGLPLTVVPKGITATSRHLRKLPTQRGLLFTNSLSSAISMRLARIQVVGYLADCRGALLHTSLVKIPGRHEVEYYWRLGAAATACWARPPLNWPDAPPAKIQLPLTESHRLAASKALTQSRIEGPYIVCCPMAVGTTLGQSKQWPHFVELCRTLHAAGHRVVICPGPGEEPRCEAFRRHAAVLPGLSLGAYAALMAGAQMVVANDSGPMHMAAAVDVPVLGVFGNGDPIRTGPWGGLYVGGNGNWPPLNSVLAIMEQMASTREPTIPKHALAA